MEDVAKTVHTQVHVALGGGGQGLPFLFLSVSRLRGAPEQWVHASALVYMQPPSRTLHESAQWRSGVGRAWTREAWVCFVDVVVRAPAFEGWPQ